MPVVSFVQILPEQYSRRLRREEDNIHRFERRNMYNRHDSLMHFLVFVRFLEYIGV